MHQWCCSSLHAHRKKTKPFEVMRNMTWNTGGLWGEWQCRSVSWAVDGLSCKTDNVLADHHQITPNRQTKAWRCRFGTSLFLSSISIAQSEARLPAEVSIRGVSASRLSEERHASRANNCLLGVSSTRVLSCPRPFTWDEATVRFCVAGLVSMQSGWIQRRKLTQWAWTCDLIWQHQARWRTAGCEISPASWETSTSLHCLL